MTHMVKTKNKVFFLGGRDLEMLTIRKLLKKANEPYHDKRLKWGAKASDYSKQINNALKNNLVPVLIELQMDLDVPAEHLIEIDHHGEQASKDKPTSLEQLFALLDMPRSDWTREFDLVAANDRGYIPELASIGATSKEIRQIRKADRTAQGISRDQERQGEIALNSARTLADGKLTIVYLPHDRTATVTDRLHPNLGGPGYENLLIVGSESAHFFGRGKIILALNKEYLGGWYGGALPSYGFWGHCHPVDGILDFLIDQCHETNSQ